MSDGPQASPPPAASAPVSMNAGDRAASALFTGLAGMSGGASVGIAIGLAIAAYQRLSAAPAAVASPGGTSVMVFGAGVMFVLAVFGGGGLGAALGLIVGLVAGALATRK